MATSAPDLFQVLRQVLTDSQILLPNSEPYKTSNGSYFSGLENDLKPAYIVQPQNADQVGNLVKALRSHLIAGSCSVAVRGRGHASNPGYANINGGVTIDLGQLKGISIREDKTLVDIAAGQTWGEVYTVLEEHGLDTPGGRMSHVGTVGFLLGVGMSAHSTKRGFGCDSVAEFSIVLASGESVIASSESNPELFAALKGGGNNFGIVTSVRTRTFPMGKWWGGTVSYGAEAGPRLMGLLVDYAHGLTDDELHMFATFHFVGGIDSATCAASLYHVGGGTDTPPSCKPFVELEPQTHLAKEPREMWKTEFFAEVDIWCPCGPRQFGFNLVIKPDLPLLLAFLEELKAAFSVFRDAEGADLQMGINLLYKQLLEASARAGPNALGLSPSDGPLIMIMCLVRWTNMSDDERVFAAIAAFKAKLQSLAAAQGKLHRWIFANYADKNQDVIGSYGEESVKQLWVVSKKYDPEGIFQRAVPGGFKLPPMEA